MWKTTRSLRYLLLSGCVVVAGEYLSAQEIDFAYRVIDASPNGSFNDVCLVGDIDNDGDEDIVIGGKEGENNLVWYEQRSSGGWQKHPIATARLEAGGVLFDVDADGDLDVVVGQPLGRKELYWFENPGVVGDEWGRHVITSAFSKYHDQLFADLDRDGREELVFASQGDSVLARVTIPADPSVSPWPGVEVLDRIVEEGLSAGDLDRDGRVDILLGGFVYWGPNSMDGSWTRQEIGDFHYARTAVGDLDLDGYPEIVMTEGESPRGRLAWFDRDGHGRAGWQMHVLEDGLSRPHTLLIADVNRDGKPDLVTGEMGLDAGSRKRLLIYLGNGDGTFDRQEFSLPYGTHESKLIDAGNDGDLDIVIKPYSYDEIGLLENIGVQRRPMTSFERVVIDSSKGYRTVFLIPADVNGDGWTDLATGRWWYENPRDGSARWQRREAGTSLGNLCAVYDIDGDGDCDVLGTEGVGSLGSSRFVWCENLGDGLDWAEHVAFEVPGGDFLQGVAVARFIEEGPRQVALSWHRSGMGICLASASFSSPLEWNVSLLSQFSQDEDLSAGDIDLDGDIDIFLGTTWLENTRGDGAGEWVVHDTGFGDFVPDRNELRDVDRDGDLDAVVGEEKVGAEGRLVWLENPGSEAPWRVHEIGRVIGPMSLDAADMDFDGDIDVVVGEHNTTRPAEGRVLVFENLGRGESWSAHLVDIGFEHHDGTRLFDCDHDGDLDIASISWTDPGVVLLYINRGAGTSSSLPVDGLQFEVQIMGSEVRIVLVVPNTLEFDYLEIWRTGPGGERVRITSIDGDDGSLRGRRKTFTDGPLLSGAYTYEVVLAHGDKRDVVFRRGIFTGPPVVFDVSQPYPVPASDQVCFVYMIASEVSGLTVEAFNLRGQSVFSRELGNLGVGRYQFTWRFGENGQPLSNGIYLVRFRSILQTTVRRVLIIQN